LSADGPLALFLDFDGTLIDLAPTPESIVVPHALASRLERLADRFDGRVALVSGRSVQNITAHLGRLAVPVAGSHGLERVLADGSAIGPAVAPIPEEIGRAVSEFAAHAHGLQYEAKTYGAALHYRAAPDLEEEAKAFAGRLAAQSGLDVKQGKCVVELVARGANKGNAVRVFMQQGAFAGASPIFVGDDLTDEDGMRAAIDLRGFGVIVGERCETLARYRLPSPERVHEWLEL